MPSAFLSGDNYLSLPRDPQPWVIKDLITAGGLTNIFGKPKTGKSFAALGMAIAVAGHAKDWLDFPIHRHGPVAYLQIDTPRSLWAERLENIRNAGLSLENIFFCDMLMSPYPYNVLEPEHHKWLQEQISDLKPVLVVVDTLRESHSGDENDSTVMRNVVSNLVSACRWKDDTGVPRSAALTFVSHSRKGTADTALATDDLMSENRGSSYVAGRMDTIIRFTSKHMLYKGRSSGQGRISIEQDDIGMVQLDSVEAEYKQFVSRRAMEMRAEDSSVSLSAMSKTIAGEKLPSGADCKSKNTVFLDLQAILGETPRAKKK